MASLDEALLFMQSSLVSHRATSFHKVQAAEDPKAV